MLLRRMLRRGLILVGKNDTRACVGGNEAAFSFFFPQILQDERLFFSIYANIDGVIRTPRADELLIFSGGNSICQRREFARHSADDTEDRAAHVALDNVVFAHVTHARGGADIERLFEMAWPNWHDVYSVFEMAAACKKHGDILFIRGGNYFLVADGTSRLHDGGGAGLCDKIESVTKREERVGRADGILQ